MQHSPAIYPIFWGSNWTRELAPLKEKIMSLYRSLSGSAYQGILTQYYDTTGRISSTVTVAEPYIDTSVAAPSNLSRTTVVEEISRAITAKGWTRSFSAQFAVLTPTRATMEVNFQGRVTGCGFHENDNLRSSYAFIPYPGVENEALFVGCTAAVDRELLPEHAMSMTAAHEYAETATNPVSASKAWANAEGFEVADICESSDDRIEPELWVQGLWDNDQRECSLSDPSPPHAGAITEGPTSVTATSATIHGTVNPESFATHYHFEYGTTTRYGTNAPSTDIELGGGVSNHAVDQAISGLSSNATYHYRLVATNSQGTAYGPDEVITHWRRQETPNWAEATTTELLGASCTAANACTAVGRYKEAVWGAMGEEWEVLELWGVASIIRNPGPSEGALFGVSCISATACEAVGKYKNSSGLQLSMAQVRNGRMSTSWRLQTIGNPERSTFTQLNAISCVSATACTTAGTYFNGSIWGAMGETWNGTSWTLASVNPNPGEQKNGNLGGVSCVTSEWCEVVGSYGDTNGDEEMYTTLREEGQPSWRYQVVAALGRLNAVSCTSRHFCMAVGDSWQPGSARAEWWDGGSWVALTPASVPGASATSLKGVSCIGPFSCYAVGTYTVTEEFLTTEHPLVEYWDGRVWALQENVEDPNLSTTVLTSVSCTESSHCIAAGHAGSVSLVETFS